MALVISTWIWGSVYGQEYVDRLRASVARNLKQEYRFIVCQPEPEDERLTKIPGCLCRLRMFSPEWQGQHEITDRLACLDLDIVITGPLDPLFDRLDPFVILKGANQHNPNPYNGSLMMLRAGSHPEVWSDFTLEKAAKVPFYSFADDQAWIWHKIPHAAGWQCGPESGIWSFAKGKGEAAWPKDNKLPEGARIVAFPGHRDPSQFTHLDFVKERWRE